MEDFEYQLRVEQEVREKKQVEVPSSRTYVDPTDGTVYEWDPVKQGWFPKIDSNFLAAYQASYGIQSATQTSEQQRPVSSSTTVATAAAAVSQLVEEATKKNDTMTPEDRKRKLQAEVEWFELDENRNTNVYVSGLPADITLVEFRDLMQQKGGIVALDDDGDPKVKLYTDGEGHLKGDGLCCYLKVESVHLAIQLLHDSKYRDHTLYVDKARFQQKGNYNPELKRKKKKGKKKKGNPLEKLLDWRERPENAGPRRMNYEKVVILKHVFDCKQFEDNPTLINDIKEDITTECGKFGTVKKCVIYDRHPEGVLSVAFKEFEGADACVQALDRRWFDGRQLSASQWDGHTQYDVEETSKERDKRLKEWEQFISS